MHACVLLNNDVDAIVRGSLYWTTSGPTSTPSWAANGSDWFDVSRRPRLQRACFTADRWDNVIGVCDRFDARIRRRRARQLAASTARGASRSFCTQFPLARVTQAKRARAAPHQIEPIEGGSVRALFEQRPASTQPLSRTRSARSRRRARRSAAFNARAQRLSQRAAVGATATFRQSPVPLTGLTGNGT
jgi:hypothetical protein